ncbi:histidine phosphatase family protein [Fictibacillus enclensis]|uniref:histidine phosphatase family protein n=1 Tax=Fictibacillus enclensis TaxID=1017270 RepID=UPI0025A19B6A|nr:histidine phosphatase family protein [Fictibacillus enclensis]MDM5197765.1 histidine phosphatase family protein [Fictibacillus enclensis]
MKRVIAVRHCKASGQERNAVLTKEGIAQSQKLKAFLMMKPIDRIISSPFVRAVDTIEPLAHFKNLPIETDERLGERILSSMDLPDWLDHLEYSFTNFEAVLEGGESSQRATDRVSELIRDIQASPDQCTVLVTHGNLLALLLRTFDERIGFSDWKQFSNPDVYEIVLDEGRVQKIWPLNW